MANYILIEVVVRSIAIVLSGGALIAGAVSLDKLLDINNSNISGVTTGIIDLLSPDVRQITASAVALAIAAGIVIPMELIMIVLRFFKIKLGILGKIIVVVPLYQRDVPNQNRKKMIFNSLRGTPATFDFIHCNKVLALAAGATLLPMPIHGHLSVDLLLIVLAICGFGVAGILSAIAAKNWSDDVLDRVPSALPFTDILTSDVVDIRNGIAAAAACTFLACGACAILLFFVIALMVKFKTLNYMAK